MKLNLFDKSGRTIFFIILFLVGVSLISCVFAKKELQIGYVDFDRLHNELPFYQRVDDLVKSKDNEMEVFRGNLYRDYLQYYKKREQDFQKEKFGKSSSEQTQITERFQADVKVKMTEINNQLETKQQEITTIKSQRNQELVIKVDQLIKDVSKKKKLDCVIEKSLIFHGGTDITSDIVNKVLKEEKKSKNVKE